VSVAFWTILVVAAVLVALDAVATAARSSDTCRHRIDGRRYVAVVFVSLLVLIIGVLLYHELPERLRWVSFGLVIVSSLMRIIYMKRMSRSELIESKGPGCVGVKPEEGSE
jgi:uncharacterized membrane protein YfcA